MMGKEVFGIVSKRRNVKKREQEEGSLWSSVPEDVLKVIFSNLGSKSLLRCCHVCKNWRNVATGDKLWSDLYKKRWRKLPPELPVRPNKMITSKSSWMLAFLQRAEVGSDGIPCPFCGKAYLRDDVKGQKDHLRSHNKVLRCSEPNCFRLFTKFDNLRNHLGSDPKRGGHGKSELLRHECSICHVRFRDRRGMTVHVRRKHTDIQVL